MAQGVISPPQTTDEVRFGHAVTIERQDGHQRSFRIVGEDEADPVRDLISYVSPLARALLGKRTGDSVRVGSWDAEIKKIG
jgi:transcription elongation GreA/GreB family factor